MKYLTSMGDDQRVLRLGGLAFLGAVWVLGLIAPPRGGHSLTFVVSFTALIAVLVLVDLTLPTPEKLRWQKLLWLVAELVLGILVVWAHGTLIRPALVYMLPANRAIMMYGQGRGMLLSLTVWLAYGVNVAMDVWPNRLGEVANYFSFFLGPYVAVVALTLAAVQQASARQRLERLYQELGDAHQELQRLHQQAQELGVTQERNRLAREIHDSLAHYLTIINVQLETAEKLALEQPERTLAEVRRARRLARECLQEVRHSVAALRATTLQELSLHTALQRLVLEFKEGTGMDVRLDFRVPDDQRVPPETALALYRAAQEGLTNVHRHAHAQRVEVLVALQQGVVALALEDDGQGPQAGVGEPGGGFGLLGLRERVELLGGHLSFGARPQGGSALQVEIPLHAS